MLNVLHQAEDALPEMLRDGIEWKNVFVNYHAPFVERLWRQWGEHRVYLHRIHPCNREDALFHPHPWPSAMKVIDGRYEMGIGYGGGNVDPEVAVRMILEAGDTYQMTDPNEWHYVRPLGRPSFSLMVTGKPWSRTAPKSDRPLPELSLSKQCELLQFFRALYA